MKSNRIALFLFIISSFFITEAQELKPKSWKTKYNAGLYWIEQGSAHLAWPYLRDAYLIAEKNYKFKSKFGKSLYKFYEASIIQNNFVYVDSLGLNEECLSYSKTLRGKKRIYYSKQIEELADSLFNRRKYKYSIDLYEERKSILELTGNTKDSSYAKVLYGLGKSLKEMGKNNTDARKYLEEAQNLVSILKPLESPDAKTISLDLISLYIVLGEEKKSKSSIDSLLKQVEQSHGRNSEEFGLINHAIGGIYYSNQLYERCFSYESKAIEIMEKVLATSSIDYLSANYYLALIEESNNNYFQAIEAFKKVQSGFKKLKWQDTDNYARVLGQIALNYDKSGDFEMALRYCNEALRVNGIENETKSKRLMDKAYFYQNMGRYKESHIIYDSAEEFMSDALGVEHPEYAKLQNNIGKLYFEEGKYEKAINYFKDAKDIVEVPDGKKWHNFYSYMLNDYAKTLFELGEVEKAIGLMKKNLEYFDKKEKVKNEAYYNRKFNLAKAYNLTKAYDKALPLIEEATKNLRIILGENHVDYGQFLDELSETYLGLGDTEKAIATLTESNSVFINQIDKIFQFSSENEKKAFIKMVTLNFNKLQSIAITNNIKDDNLNALNLNNQLMLKGLLLNNSKDVLLKLKELNDDDINSKITSYKFLKSKRSKVLTQAFNERVFDIDSLTKIINLKEAELVRIYNSNFKEETKLIRDWEEVKRQLKPTEYAIEFSHFNVIENHKSTDKIKYVAYIISADSDFPIMVNLFDENELQQVTRRKKPNQLYSNSQLYNLIWKSLADYLPINSTIYYSPSGLLNQIAFVAIKKGNQSLIDLYELNQISSTYKLTEPIQSVNFDSSLLVGGINYEYELRDDVNTSEKRISYIENSSLKQLRGNKSRGESWTKLEGTVSEMQSIKSILNSKSAVTTLSDNNATESYFKALSGDSPNIIHIATHGYFFEKINKVDEDTGLSMEDQYRLSDDPLLRSGLIFAGANYAWKNGYNPPNEAEDGILTALEISNLDLSNTDLVVLSACETGLGDIDGSEGVYGLQRAFKMAGVDRLIMSLWEVPDEETSSFMITFYDNWTKNKSIRDAFIDTQRQMKKSQPNNPEAWAAFVLFE